MRTISFPFRIGPRGSVDDTSVSRKIWVDRVRAVLSTQIGSRVMRPGFGTNSSAMVFSLGTPAEDDIPSSIRAAFSKHLPSIRVEDVSIAQSRDNNTLTIRVVFTCPDRSTISTNVTFADGAVTYDVDPYEVITQ